MDFFEDLKKIVNINSYTGNKEGVDAVGKMMTEWLSNLGFKVEVFNRKNIGNHLLFKTKEVKNKSKILLLGHNDTVFPKGYFENFSEDEKWIYGPGVCDMKGGNIIALQALRNIFKENKEIFNIDFLLVSDEESGSDDSKSITASLAKKYDYCFVFEAAGKNLEIVTARKGVGKYIVEVNGKAAHAGTSYTKGIDANFEAAIKLKNYYKLTNFEEGTIINVGKIEGGIGLNTVSPKCTMMIEFRFKNNKEKKRVLKGLNNVTSTSYIKGTLSKGESLIQREVMEENEEQLNLINFLEKLINTSIKKEARGGVSDANIVSSCGTTTLDGFGPYGDGDHTLKERALKSSFYQRIEMVTKILKYYQN